MWDKDRIVEREVFGNLICISIVKGSLLWDSSIKLTAQFHV